MNTITIPQTPTSRLFITGNRQYGVTEQKKAELDALAILVADAQQDVDQSEAIVAALNDKIFQVQALLISAEATRTSTGNNRKLADQLVQSAKDLNANSSIAQQQTMLAFRQAEKLAPEVNKLMGQVIYCAEIINKLSNVITRKKALNPLISDELISLIATAGKDANTAVALTLVALQSAFAAEASNTESSSAIALEYRQAGDFLKMLSSLHAFLENAYKDANATYSQMEKALIRTTAELATATGVLNTAAGKLKSLQSGLSAANAAAYAA